MKQNLVKQNIMKQNIMKQNMRAYLSCLLLASCWTAALPAGATAAPPVEVLAPGEVAEIEPGIMVWTNREYRMTEWPEELSEYRYFVRSTMGGTRIRVNQPGYVIALTPLDHLSQAEPLKEDGFEYVDLEPFNPYLLRGDRGPGQLCMALQRPVQAGEELELGYYGIFVWGTKGMKTTESSPRVQEITIPTIDISRETDRHVIVAEGTETLYQGHVDTLLMPDGKTMFAVWAINHAGHLGPLARSDDAGLTWEKIEVPDNWWEVGETDDGQDRRGIDRRTTPTIHRLVDPEGIERIFVFAGQNFPGRMRQAYSEDGGRTWTPMRDTGLAAECPPKSILSFDDGERLVMYCDRRNPEEARGPDSNPVVWKSSTYDGGLGWTPERVVVEVPTQWAQPAVIRSPDGERAVMQMRFSGNGLSPVAVSDDGGSTWSEAREANPNTSGHRPNMVYAPDGRVVLVFRDRGAEGSPTMGHFVAWVGTFDDLYYGRDGQYRIKLMHSYAGGDNAYSGLEVLPDGTIVATNYIKYWDDDRRHSIVSTRFKLQEMDQMLEDGELIE